MLAEESINYLSQGKLVKEESQNKGYEGQVIQIGESLIRSRLGKATPKKKGYFTVFWEKNSQGTNVPYTNEDPCDFLLVTVANDSRSGYFLFPKACLIAQGILKSPSYPGKMGMRVYPIWEEGLNRTALQTQKWQLPFFRECLVKDSTN